MTWGAEEPKPEKPAGANSNRIREPFSLSPTANFAGRWKDTMVSAMPLSQPSSWQSTPTVFSPSIKNRLAGSMPYTALQVSGSQPGVSETPRYRQWPYRGFAFASDLGLVGYLIKQPILGSIGWLIALPYYAYALLQHKDTRGKKEEALYQATANGIFPFIEAKLGVMAGDFAPSKLPKSFKKSPTSILHRLPNPVYKGIGGLLALLILTPTLGDPLSHRLVGKYQTSPGRKST